MGGVDMRDRVRAAMEAGVAIAQEHGSITRCRLAPTPEDSLALALEESCRREDGKRKSTAGTTA